jgi:hypothetical protein
MKLKYEEKSVNRMLLKIRVIKVNLIKEILNLILKSRTFNGGIKIYDYFLKRVNVKKEYVYW